jgi:hypothetical protein
MKSYETTSIGNLTLIACLSDLQENGIDASLVNATTQNSLGTFEINNDSQIEIAEQIMNKYFNVNQKD